MSNRASNTAKRIRSQISRIPAGTPFTVASLRGLGPRHSVDQTIFRLVKAGRIERVSRGVYMRPLQNRYVGTVMPGPRAVAESLAKSSRAKLQIGEAEAARQFGFSTQMAAKSVFLTSGPARVARVGQQEVTLKRAGPRRMALAGRPAGAALAALRYLGKEEVSVETIEAIRQKLSEREFAALKKATYAMPGWLADVFHKHAKESEDGPTVPHAA